MESLPRHFFQLGALAVWPGRAGSGPSAWPSSSWGSLGDCSSTSLPCPEPVQVSRGQRVFLRRICLMEEKQ